MTETETTATYSSSHRELDNPEIIRLPPELAERARYFCEQPLLGPTLSLADFIVEAVRHACDRADLRLRIRRKREAGK